MSPSDSKTDSAGLVDRCAAECLERGWRLAWLMLRHREDAADAVQQAFVVALNKRHKIPHDNPWPWLAAVIAREAQYIRRKRGRHAVGLDAGGPAMPIEDKKTEEPLAGMVEREREEQLARALDDLPADERDALLVAKLGGLTYADAAEALGVPLGTLNHRITRALATLRRRLREDDEPAVARTLAVLPVIAVPEELRNALNASALGVGGSVGGFIALGGIAMKKTTAVVLALLFVLLLGAGGAFVLIESPDKEEPAQVSTEVTSDNDEADPVVKARPETNQPSPPAEADPGDAIEPNSFGDTVDVPDPALPERRLLIVKDQAGNPVSLNFVVDWRINADGEWTTQQVTTDAEGRAELEAPPEATLRLNLDETNWVLGWSNFLVKEGEVEASVTAYALKPLRVKITYADGKPFTGHVTVKAGKLWQAGLSLLDSTRMGESVPAGWPHRGDRVTGLSAGVINFAGLPSGLEFSFIATSDRAGYAEATRVVSSAEVDSGELIEIVVPEGISDWTPGKIILKPNEGESVDGKCRLFKVRSDGSWTDSAWNSRDPLESGNVWTGRYVVVVLGARTWHSEAFDLAPGETIELQPKFTTSSSLRARVVDETGAPVPGAALAFATTDLPNAIRLAGVRSSGPRTGEAVSAEDGKLHLHDLPVGTFKFQIYARGKQPWEGHATLIGGQVCDLGDIRLEEALGKVEVQFPDWDFGKRKLTWTLMDADRNTVDRGDVESGVLVLDKLPVGRTYRLQFSIKEPRGSRAFWFIKPFDLTLAAPTQEFDGTDKKWPANLD